ncbi:MAG: hypothetical protein MUC99_04470 [Anaerolineae bacterium]|nr:hypothetical protein [Anaerolineae bacterium]
MTDFNLGLKRRKIEDGIVARYHKVNFKKRDEAWLEDQLFWDYVFSWYELAHYYENSLDTGIGAHMLELYAECVTRFRTAAANPKLRERRRDKAADALYQINYYVNQMMIAIDRNSRALDDNGNGGTPVLDPI